MARVKVTELDKHPEAADLRHGCFYCLDNLTGDDDLVYWAGSGGRTIWLHAECAQRWSRHLWADGVGG